MLAWVEEYQVERKLPTVTRASENGGYVKRSRKPLGNPGLAGKRLAAKPAEQPAPWGAGLLR